MLIARGLGVRRAAHEVLTRVDAAFGTGWTAVVGPNGAGKSTLLRVLAGLMPPAQGEVVLDGRRLDEWPDSERARRIAWLAQQGEAEGELTVREVVQLGRLPHLGLFGTPGPEDDRAVDAALDATECTPWQHRRLHALSGGERQRALLARALATEAPVLLLDEPTTHLDAPHQVALVKLLRRLAAGRTIVSVMHDLPLALHADRVLVLKGGRVHAEGAHDDAALHQALVAAFEGAIRIEARGGRAVALPDLAA